MPNFSAARIKAALEAPEAGLTKKALTEMKIESTFYSVGVASELSPNYYLIGDRAVADAGHILRHFLPKE